MKRKLYDLLDDVILYACIITVLVGVLCGEAHCAPDTPKPMVERDPGAWAITGMFTPVGVGTFTKPAYGLAAGVGVCVASNTHNSTNMLACTAGSAGGYLVIKGLRRLGHHKH